MQQQVFFLSYPTFFLFVSGVNQTGRVNQQTTPPIVKQKRKNVGAGNGDA